MNSSRALYLVAGMVIGYLTLKDSDYSYVELSIFAVSTFLLLWLALYVLDLVIDGFKARRNP